VRCPDNLHFLTHQTDIATGRPDNSHHDYDIGTRFGLTADNTRNATDDSEGKAGGYSVAQLELLS